MLKQLVFGTLLPEEKRVFFQDCSSLGEYIIMVEWGESEIHQLENVLKLEEIPDFYSLNFLKFPQKRTVINLESFENIENFKLS